MIQLYGLNYSPWTEKARWALDVSNIQYEYTEYLPLLTTPLLAFKLGNPFAKVTVPVMFHDGGQIMDSFEIAKYAAKRGRGNLLPTGSEKIINQCNDLCETALRAIRALVIEKTARSSGARQEALPHFTPDGLRPVLTPVADLGLAYLRWKHHTTVVPVAEQRIILRKALTEARKLLNGQKYVLEHFSFCDMALALTVQGVSPVGDHFLPLDKYTRDAWSEPELAGEFADLIEWRDMIYGNHRNY